MVNKRLAELLRCVYGTCDQEIDGTTWDQEACKVAEMIVRGEDIAPLLSQYLDNSPDCREEFLALVAILRAERAADTNENTTAAS